MDIIKYSFDEINAMSRSLASTAKKHNFTNIIGISRGGLIPAAIISYELDIPLLTIAVSSYNKKEKSKFKVIQDFNIDTLDENSNILIVDDICDTGETMRWVSSKLSQARIKNLITCIFTKPKHTEYLDFYGSVIPDNKWIVFPWE
tara:strand:- start:258 stop:695 length:438 start_codon:yes stop_codon:yes gene_type:complete